MEPVSIHFKLSEKEFLTAARLLLFPNLKSRLNVGAGYLIWAFILTLMFMAAFGLGVPFAASLSVTLLVYLSHHYYFTLPRRSYHGDRKFREGMTLTFTEEHIECVSKQIEAKVSWKLYTDVLEGETCYVLVYGKDMRMMSIVPKRAFKSKQQERAFRGLLAAHFDRALSANQLTTGADAMQEYEPTSLQPPDWR